MHSTQTTHSLASYVLSVVGSYFCPELRGMKTAKVLSIQQTACVCIACENCKYEVCVEIYCCKPKSKFINTSLYYMYVQSAFYQIYVYKHFTFNQVSSDGVTVSL